MTLNINKPVTNTTFDSIGDGECFRYNGDYFMMVHDENRDTEYFGVNLATGAVRDFDSYDKVQAVTATVTFKEIQ